MKKTLLLLLVTLGFAAAAMQLFQPTFENPAVPAGASFEEVAKPPAGVAATLNRACGDCHSNHTRYPWYSKISPVSWLLDRDVRMGRANLNFSAWNQYGSEMSLIRLTEICAVIQKEEMPDPKYLLLHPEAKLSAAEKASICALSAAR